MKKVEHPSKVLLAGPKRQVIPKAPKAPKA